MMKKQILPLIIALGFTSCSSIVSKSDYPVTFTSSKPTSVKVIDQKSGKVVHQATTPTTTTLSASSGFFRPAKYSLMTKSVKKNLNAKLDSWYVGNVLFGGLIGFLIVDPATGNMWKLPNDIDLTPQQAYSVTNPSP
ncbi:MAG: hypothetical protein KJO21_09925 [Verrucomicrobiae bacterium]|nr:hypothetical protein [Verrucomicrobiae bacterium]NNJ43776.1 hypothetical protein [Akkermansiaceae bacterium]